MDGLQVGQTDIQTFFLLLFWGCGRLIRPQKNLSSIGENNRLKLARHNMIRNLRTHNSAAEQGAMKEWRNIGKSYLRDAVMEDTMWWWGWSCWAPQLMQPPGIVLISHSFRRIFHFWAAFIHYQTRSTSIQNMSEATINTNLFGCMFFFWGGEGVVEGGAVKIGIRWKTPMQNPLNKPDMEVEDIWTTRNTQDLDGLFWRKLLFWGRVGSRMGR